MLIIESVIILDELKRGTLNTVNIGENIYSPCLRELRTTMGDTLEMGIEYLELPNILFQVGSAFLSYCEMHQIPANLIASLRQRRIDIQSIKAYEKIIPFLNLNEDSLSGKDIIFLPPCEDDTLYA
jgi:hypothetical protein